MPPLRTPGPGAYDISPKPENKGYGFSTDTRERRYQEEVLALGGSPGPKYNVTTIVQGNSNPAWCMGTRNPEVTPEHVKVPGPGQYTPRPPGKSPTEARAPTFAWGGSPRKAAARTFYQTTDTPGPKYDTSTKMDTSKGFTWGASKRQFAGLSSSRDNDLATARSLDDPEMAALAAKLKPFSPGNFKTSPHKPSKKPVTPGWSFGLKCKNVFEIESSTPGPAYTPNYPQKNVSGPTMRPPTVRPETSNATPRETSGTSSELAPLPPPPAGRAITFGVEERDYFYNRLRKAANAFVGTMDYDTRTKRGIGPAAPAYTLRSRGTTSNWETVGPGPGAYDTRQHLDKKKGRGFSFGTDTRERAFQTELKKASNSPGPIYNISPVKVRLANTLAPDQFF